MNFLIVKHEEYGEDSVCIPQDLTDDWHSWVKDNTPDYDYEVWEYTEKGFKLVKNWDEPLDCGMVFGVWTFDNDNPEEEGTFQVIERIPDLDRHDKVPEDILYILRKKNLEINGTMDSPKHIRVCLKYEGQYAIWNEERDKCFIYGEYWDHHLPIDW